jgi:hypothetical protein
MIRIVLDSEQAKTIAESHETVELCDESGKVLGVVNPAISPDELLQIAEIKRRMTRNQPRYTTAEVLEHMEKLTEK